MKLSIEKKVIAGVGVALAVLLVNGIVSYRVTQRFLLTDLIPDLMVCGLLLFVSYSTIRHTTARKRIEEQKARLLAREQAAREHAEAVNRAKDHFIAVISHEIRTPLNAILGWGQMLRTDTLDEAQKIHALQAIVHNAKSQARLVDDLLDTSRIITSKMELDIHPVELRQVVEAAVDSIRPMVDAKHLQLDTHIEPDGNLVSGDPNRLEQVVWNLLTNAAKFTPKHGRIEVRVARINAHVQITVSDSGVGIEPEFLPFVFDRFSQGNTGERQCSGLGLGLAIVRDLVELHGGAVRADSQGDGMGATFTVTLPVRVVREERRESEQAIVPIVSLTDTISMDAREGRLAMTHACD